jgi:hypothetical protein
MSSGPPPAPVLVAALVVLLVGVAAAVAHDDSDSRSSPPLASSAYASSGSSSPGSSTTRTSPRSTAPTTTAVVTSVRPAVPSPEAAANGLWAAYTATNRTAAQRFATDDVVRVLFEVEYSGEKGTFQGCRPQPDGFACLYTQPSTQYAMTVRAGDSGSFEVVELTVTSSQ